jgi:hypothetical protein
MEEIECCLREVGLYGMALQVDDERKKCGRYEGGHLNVPGFGTQKWTVAASIITESPLGELMESGLSEEEIVSRCVRFLNKPRTKRARKLKYGRLSCRYFVVHDDHISVSLVTDDRNNKNFWGRGTKKPPREQTRRGRPRKTK